MAASTESTARTYEAVKDPRPEAIVVYCGDPRFQKAFDAFVETELGLKKGEFIPLVVAGGGGALARPERLPKEFKFMKERLELYRTYFSSIRRVILINHEDCKYYESLKERVLGFLGPHGRLLDRSREDLPVIAQIFGRQLSHLGVSVELYHARFADPEHTRIVFDPVIKVAKETAPQGSMD